MKQEIDIFSTALEMAATQLIARAKTAPKAAGKDSLVYRLAEKEDIKALQEEIVRLGIESDTPYFIRDAENLNSIQTIVLVGTKDQTRGVPQCGYCGFGDCKNKMKNKGRCAYDLIDLGIALGSALSLAQTLGIDNRVMFTLGKAALSLGWMENCYAAFGIPLSISEKNIFFDRQRI
ncbi:ferredoxin domain-containing protein [Guggenheimella bovis]